MTVPVCLVTTQNDKTLWFIKYTSMYSCIYVMNVYMYIHLTVYENVGNYALMHVWMYIDTVCIKDMKKKYSLYPNLLTKF